MRTEGTAIPAMIAGVLVYGLAVGASYPLLGLVLAGQVPAAWNGLNAAAMGLGMLAGIASLPRLARWLGAGRTVLLGVLAMALALGLMAWEQSFALLFGARLLLGWGSNLMFVVVETAINQQSAAGRRGRILGLYVAANTLGFVVGPALVALAPDRPGPLLAACAAVALLSLLPFSRARRILDRQPLPPAGGALAVVRALPFAFALVLLASLVDSLVLSLLPVILTAQGASAASSALMVALFHVGLMVGQPLVGFGLDRLGRRRTVLACCGLACLATGLLAAGGAGEGPLPVLAFLVWGGSTYGLYTAGLALLGDRFAGGELLAGTGTIAAVYALAAVAAPLSAGSLLQALGPGDLFAVTALLYLLAGLAGACRFRPPEPSLGERGAGGTP